MQLVVDPKLGVDLEHVTSALKFEILGLELFKMSIAISIINEPVQGCLYDVHKAGVIVFKGLRSGSEVTAGQLQDRPRWSYCQQERSLSP